MCGIVGVINQKNAPNFILSALKTLEYRGYDSAGIYIREDKLFKTLSRVDSLKSKIASVDGIDGIGHTRWATHGFSTLNNAHPHQSYHKLITLVHNGIISNYESIKNFLIKKNYKFYGETDTEILTNYIEYLYLQHKNPETILFNLLDDIQGELAIAFFIKDDPSLYYLKRESPLVIAKKNNTYSLSSDVLAINNFEEFYYPEDGEMGYININEQVVYKNYKKTSINFKKEDYSCFSSSKGHFKHYMLKEIYEEPLVVDRLKKYISTYNLQEIRNLLKNSNKVIILGCGTSYNAGYYITKFLNKNNIISHVASEYKDFEDATYILISQSGETYDLISAVKKIKNTDNIILLTNNIHSTLARLVKHVIYLNAGNEIAVAATKSYISTILLLTYLFKDINYNEVLSKAKLTIKNTLYKRNEIKQLASKIYKLQSLYCVSKNIGEAILKEAALKIKEISYIHAESIYSGELKHGSISTLDKNFGCIFLITDKTMISNIKEVEARNSPVFILSEDSNLPASPKEIPYLSAMVYLELLSYEISNLLKRDIDKPRNLAKSVTVI